MKYIEMAKKNGKKIISTVLCAAMIVTGAAFAPAAGIYAEENNAQEEISSDVENLAEETTTTEEELEDSENVSDIALFAANSAVTFDYNGYPYGIISDSTITLTVKLKSGTDQTVEWYRSDSKDGNYTKIDGADKLSYSFTAEDDTAYWYKCSVDGNYTEAVQVIYATPYADSGKELKVYSHRQGGGVSAWYISNGTMAYTSGEYFDVVGTYTYAGSNSDLIGQTIWISTSYGGGWSTDGIEKIICTFSPDEPHGVLCTALLADSSTQFGLYADVCLGSDELFGKLADYASLKAVIKDGKAEQIQMVGAYTVDSAKVTDPSFVLYCIDAPTSFFMCDYYDVEYIVEDIKDMYYSYNTQEKYWAAENYEDIDGKKVVTELAGNIVVDSVFAMGWTDVETETRVVHFNFNIGSAEQTGAEIKAEPEVTSTTVTVTQTDGVAGTVQFRLYDKANDTYTDWITPDADTKQAVFKDLTPNHTYEIQAKNVDAADDTAESMGDITTAIDPLKPGSGSTGGGEALPVESTVKSDSISFKNLSPEYQYRLLDENDNDVTGWAAPSGDDNSIVFGGLQPGKKYYLVAKTDDNSLTEKVEYVTPSMLDSKKDAAKAELEQKLAEYIEAVESMEFLSDSEKSEYKSNLTESKEYWCSQIDDVTSSDEEDNIKQYKENGLTNMETKFSDAEKVNLSHAKENAREQIEKAAIDAKAKVEKMSDLGAEEAETAKAKIDEAKNSALAAVENAGDIEELTSVKNTGIESIKSESDKAAELDLSNAKTKAKAEIAAAAADAKNNIDAMNGLSNEEKDAFKADIDKKSEETIKAIDDVTVPSGKSDMESLKQHVINEIEQIKNEAAGKKNEDNDDNKDNDDNDDNKDSDDNKDNDDNKDSDDNKDNNDSSDTKPAVKYEDIKDTVVKPEEEFEYGNGNIKVIIESKSINDVDDTTINGFFVTSYENIVNACLDDSDKQKVAEGQKVEIRLVLTDVGDTVPEADKNVITNQLAEYSTEKAGLSLGQYIDLNLEMKVGDAQWMKIPEAKQEIEITIDIPDSLKMQGAVYYIIRCHDGECTLLEDLDDSADTITIKTDKFSTYAIVYTRNAQYVAPGTGYTANMQVWFVMVTALIAGLTVMGVGFTRKKCK